MLPQIIFGYLSFVIIVTSILVVTRKNVVHSVLWMLVLFLHIAALFLFLNAEFLAAIQIIIYAGAMLVLYLFVIMLLNLKQEEILPRFSGFWPLGFLLAAGLIFLLGLTVRTVIRGPSGIYTAEVVKKTGHLGLVGKVLYTEYIFPFEVLSVILLVAIVGAIVIAKKRLKS